MEETALQKTPLNGKFFLSGVVLLFFIIHWIELFYWGEPWAILWICNISNVVLALGILLNGPILIGISVEWLILGLPLWIIDGLTTGDFYATSILTHLGALALGLYALYHADYKKYTWVYAVAYFVVLQQLARWLTPPEQNINLAHSVYPGWDQIFSTYLTYWIFNFLLSIALLVGAEWGLYYLYNYLKRRSKWKA